MVPRFFLAAIVWLAVPAWGGPPLTTVQDVIYKADGTRFNGTLTVSWKSFEASDQSAIAMHSLTTKIVDGNLRVQLVPTTSTSPAVFYQVTYNSDGRVQFTESWSVPASGPPLRLRDVRTSPSAISADDGNTTVLESDVVGLIADLGGRPLKGPGFAGGRVAFVNATGAIESVTGAASDCVHVDGSTSSCGGDQPSFIDGDSLTGIVDGANTVFSISAAPNPATSLSVYRNGLLQKLTQDYTFGGRTIQFAAASAPQPGDTLLASYRLSTGDTSTAQLFPNSQILCGGTGSATTSTTLGSIGMCAIPAGVLQPGDRVEVHYDLSHQGIASGFSFELHWGATTVAHRDGPAADTAVTGRADAAILASGAQLSFQTWGSVLPFAAGIAAASDPYATGLTLDFRGSLAQTGDTLSLTNYTVVRLP